MSSEGVPSAGVGAKAITALSTGPSESSGGICSESNSGHADPLAPAPTPASTPNWEIIPGPIDNTTIGKILALGPNALMSIATDLPETIPGEFDPDDVEDEALGRTPGIIVPQGHEVRNAMRTSAEGVGIHIAGLSLDENEWEGVKKEVGLLKWTWDGDDRRYRYLIMVTAARQKAQQSFTTDKDTAVALEKWFKSVMYGIETWAKAVKLDTKETCDGQMFDTASGLLQYVDKFTETLERAEATMRRTRPGEYSKLKIATQKRDAHSAGG